MHPGNGGGGSPAAPPSPERPRPPNGRTIPQFDPGPSGRFAREALAGAGVEGALIGRLAVWAWVPDPGEHAFTKDLDIAIRRADLPRLLEWLAARRLPIRTLPIGGVNVADPATGANVDFIDRTSPEWGDLSPLFEEAVASARASGETATVGGVALPLVPAEVLTAMKVATGTRKDREDAARVLRGVPLSVDRVRRLVAAHAGPAGIGALEDLLREVGHPAARTQVAYEDSE